MSSNKSSKFGFGIILGTIIGAVAGILFAPQEGEKTRKELLKKKEEIEKLLKEKDVDKKVKEIFDVVNTRTKKLYREAEISLIENLSKVREGWKNIDKETYKKLVSDTIDGFRKDTKIGLNKANKLKKQFLKDWDKLTKKTPKIKKSRSKTKKNK